MKKLYIIRHAKTEDLQPKARDFDRALTLEGIQDATNLGKMLLSLHLYPDTILTSPALRAKTTAKLISKELGCMERVILEPKIYEATKSDLLQLLKYLKDDYATVFIIGHNPALSYLGHHLINFNDHLSPCGILEIELDMHDWSDIEMASAKGKIL